MNNTRIFVKRKTGFDQEDKQTLYALNHELGLPLTFFSEWVCYDLFGLSDDEVSQVVNAILCDKVSDELALLPDKTEMSVFGASLHMGQFDQRGDSAMQCASLLLGRQGFSIEAKKVYITNPLSNEALDKLKKYFINPVEMEAFDPYASPKTYKSQRPKPVEVIQGFTSMNDKSLSTFKHQFGLTLSLEDLVFIQAYYTQEKREPTETELRVLDTYWSDHCRHTTFETELIHVQFDEQSTPAMQASYDLYENLRSSEYNKKPRTLMHLATAFAKQRKKAGLLPDLEVSEEINAASIYIDTEEGKGLLMFKNETHNHPTEIEPYGGASTCLGGAIRDPLSGRSYVFQSARVTGRGPIQTPIEETLKGKLPQRVISKKAALGFSSYGNQIGLTCTLVKEFEHPGFVAKRLEVGAVVGYVNAENIKREQPTPGDVILLIGGDTGRDGIGGATGSSKEHDASSIETKGAEVQKGNAVTERKIQRLFQNKAVTQRIKKANDFGAGGVSVAVTELADGLRINLSAIQTKYEGLNATELAISESQERMAVVCDINDAAMIIQAAYQENLKAYEIARVTDTSRIIMVYENEEVLNIRRDFLNTSGVRQRAQAIVKGSPLTYPKTPISKNAVIEHLKHPNIATNIGLIEQFDASIGSSSVLLPLGGKYQLSEVDVSVQKIPLKNTDTDVASIVAYGFDPYLMEKSPYHGAYLAVVESLAKFVSVGGDYSKARLSFQEYFKRLGTDPYAWGDVLSALLGAFQAQNDFNAPAIGGKDSMSGTFEQLHVPPTFISFAFGVTQASEVISPELKDFNHKLYLIDTPITNEGLPNSEAFKTVCRALYINKKAIKSMVALKSGGLLEGLMKAAIGNQIGFSIATDEDIFQPRIGQFLISSESEISLPYAKYLGYTAEGIRINSLPFTLEEITRALTDTITNIYPYVKHEALMQSTLPLKNTIQTDTSIPVNVLIPVFPGTNCESDSKKAFHQENVHSTELVILNHDEEALRSSLEAFERAIDNTDILMLSGGFSAADEPDGSGKFIASILQHERIYQAIERLTKRKGLVIGICNGFQALVKSGLLPFGFDSRKTAPVTLYKNTIAHHVSKMVNVEVVSTNNPFFTSMQTSETHIIPVSHGEGKFMLPEEVYQTLLSNDQIVTCYQGYNPNGSHYGIEGIVSPCKRILGKMAHNERVGTHLYKNLPHSHSQDIFSNAVQSIRQGR